MNNDDHHDLAALIASIGSTSPAFDEDVRVAYDEDGHIIKLNLGALHLSALPDELWQFTHLQELQLFDNELSDISSGIGQLTALEDLSLAGAQLRSLPDTLWRLANLQSLNLGWNEDLRVLPPEIGQLRNVRRLGLFHMNLRELPIELFELTQLEALDVRNNHLTMLPNEVLHLLHLRELIIGGNQLVELPPGLSSLPHLEVLDLQDMPSLRFPPPEIIEEGHTPVVAYLREQHGEDKPDDTDRERSPIMFSGLTRQMLTHFRTTAEKGISHLPHLV